MLVSFLLNVTMGNGFKNLLRVKKNREKKFSMNIYLCGHVRFIHVAVDLDLRILFIYFSDPLNSLPWNAEMRA